MTALDMDRIRRRARELLGTPFIDKGRLETDGGLDCYGLVRELWRAGGVELPDTKREDFARVMELVGEAVRPTERRVPGAIVVKLRGRVACDHVGVYLGEGRVAQAVHGLGVVTRRWSGGRDEQRYLPA